MKRLPSVLAALIIFALVWQVGGSSATVWAANCPGAEPVVAFQTYRLPPYLPVGQGAIFSPIFAIPDTLTIRTTTNYAWVEGLILVERHTFREGYSHAFIYPEWLLEAYGNDLWLIRQELTNGRLFDRGPCR